MTTRGNGDRRTSDHFQQLIIYCRDHFFLSAVSAVSLGRQYGPPEEVPQDQVCSVGKISGKSAFCVAAITCTLIVSLEVYWTVQLR